MLLQTQHQLFMVAVSLKQSSQVDKKETNKIKNINIYIYNL